MHLNAITFQQLFTTFPFTLHLQGKDMVVRMEIYAQQYDNQMRW